MICPHCNARLYQVGDEFYCEVRPSHFQSQPEHYRLVDPLSQCQRFQQAHQDFQQIADEVGGRLDFPAEGGMPSLVVDVPDEPAFWEV